MEKIPIATYEQNGPDALRARIENAKPLLDIFMDECVEQQPDDGPGRLSAMRLIAGPFSLIWEDDLARRIIHPASADSARIGTDIIESGTRKHTQRTQSKSEQMLESNTNQE